MSKRCLYDRINSLPGVGLLAARHSLPRGCQADGHLNRHRTGSAPAPAPRPPSTPNRADLRSPASMRATLCVFGSADARGTAAARGRQRVRGLERRANASAHPAAVANPTWADACVAVGGYAGIDARPGAELSGTERLARRPTRPSPHPDPAEHYPAHLLHSPVRREARRSNAKATRRTA